MNFIQYTKEILDKVDNFLDSIEDNLHAMSNPKKTKEVVVKEVSENKEDNFFICNNEINSTEGFLTILKDNGYKNGIKYEYKNKKHLKIIEDTWKVWFPDGYNKIDEKLNKIKIKNDEQLIFAIPGCDNVVSKYNVCKTLYDFYGKDKAMKIIPESFLLDKKEDLKFLKEGERFILKKKVQRKEGLKITSDIKEVKLAYKDDYLIAQKLIKPFLINGRKVNLRIYVMVVLHNDKLELYVNDYGSCIYTKDKYDEKSDDFEHNITSYKMELDVYDDNPLTLEQFRTYLNDNNIDSNDFFNKINNNLSLFIMSMKDQLGNNKFKKNKCVQIFGVDFIIDENMNPYLLEWNKGPDMKPRVKMLYNPNITNEIITKINKLTTKLVGSLEYDEKLKIIKETYKDLYSGYPKPKKYKDILSEINDFLNKEKKLKSYPSGYISGTGLKIQQDSLSMLGLIDKKENNGFKKIIEI